jgi:tetratricopeptide (TPR) repeat protein
LTSFGSSPVVNSSSNFRGTSYTSPQSNVHSRTTYGTPHYNTHSHGYSFPSYSWGIGVSIGLGYIGYGIGWSSHYGHHYGGHYNSYYGSHYSGHHYGGHAYHRGNVYYGLFSMAWLIGNAYTLVPYHSNYYSYHNPFRRRYCSYTYAGTYCRVRRPYWYGLGWRTCAYPWGYGYSSRYRQSIYSDPFYDDDWGVPYSERSNRYDDGYDDGYDRGYEEGADESSAYADDRRRDAVYSKGSSYKKKRAVDKRSTNAAKEFEIEFNRGNQAFKSGDFKTASKAYKEAVITAPNNADARYGLAISAFAEGKYTYASFNLRKGLGLNAQKGELDLQAAFGGPAVLAEFKAALNAEMAEYANDEDLLLLHGFVALRTGNAKAAAESLDKLLSANPDDTVTKELYSKALSALENE